LIHKQNPLPMHNNATPAAEAAMAAAAQGKYWEYEALLFSNQQSLDRPHFEQFAEQLHLNMARFRHDLDTHAQQALIEADKQLAQQLGAQGTPMFFINGRKLRGA